MIKVIPTIFIIILIGSCGISTPIEKKKRPANWAKKIETTSLYNFYQIDENLYRSEQPSKSKMVELEKFGIKAIVNLRNIKSDKNEAKNCKIQLYHKRINTWTISEKEIIESLKLIINAPKPVLVHCKHGSDRTGCLVALYRMVIMNWSKEEAINEFKLGGFGYHEDAFPNIIELLEKINIEKVKSLI